MMLECAWSSVSLHLLYAVGLYATILYLYEALESPVCIVWNVVFPSRSLKERYGPWAVITGSSDGIGKQYALNLAREGMNLVLISRTKSKLEKVAQEIQGECNVEVKLIDVDFYDGDHVYDRIQKELKGLDVGVLVNNVGCVHKFPATVDEISISELRQTFTVNMYPAVRIVQMLLPDMKQRRRGIVVNVSSASGHCALPYATMYAASKAFLDSFSRGLQEELLGSGVECQLVGPMLVDTNMIADIRQNLFIKLMSIDVEAFGKTAAWLIGKTNYTTGCCKHAIQTIVITILPRWIITKMLGSIVLKMGRYMEKKS